MRCPGAVLAGVQRPGAASGIDAMYAQARPPGDEFLAQCQGFDACVEQCAVGDFRKIPPQRELKDDEVGVEQLLLFDGDLVGELPFEGRLRPTVEEGRVNICAFAEVGA